MTVSQEQMAFNQRRFETNILIAKNLRDLADNNTCTEAQKFFVSKAIEFESSARFYADKLKK